MTRLTLTKSKMIEGVWHGIITGGGSTEPEIAVTHGTATVSGVGLSHDGPADHWVVTIPVPATAIADGIQTLLITDKGTDTKLGDITVIADDRVTTDLRVEMELLRAELDMLKRAFRRHCLETT